MDSTKIMNVFTVVTICITINIENANAYGKYDYTFSIN